MTDKKINEERKETDILDHFKSVERMIRTRLLVKAINQLKEKAREIIELKAECTMVLEESGVKEKDIKRILDFINDTPEVQLSDEDKKELRQSVRNRIKREKEDVKKAVDKQLDNTPISTSYSTSASSSPSNSFSGDVYSYFFTDSDPLNGKYDNITLTSTTGESLNLKV
jgi:hypothetical protein